MKRLRAREKAYNELNDWYSERIERVIKLIEKGDLERLKAWARDYRADSADPGVN